MSKGSYGKTALFLSFANIVCMILLAISGIKSCNLSNEANRLAHKAIAEPKFKVSFDQVTPPVPISSQKADPYRIFEPDPDRYAKASFVKSDVRENRIRKGDRYFVLL